MYGGLPRTMSKPARSEKKISQNWTRQSIAPGERLRNWKAICRCSSKTSAQRTLFIASRPHVFALDDGELAGLFVEVDAHEVRHFLRIGSSKTVAGFNLEIEVGQCLGPVGIDGQAQPQPEHGDVGGEGVDVHAVEAVLDDVELDLVDFAGVVLEFVGVEQAVEVDDFVEQAEQVSARAAGGIDGADGVEGCGNLLRLIDGDASDVVLVDKGGDFVVGDLGEVGQVALEGFAAHEADDRARGVVAAGLVPAGDEFFEDFAEHFRIDGDFDVERGGFLNGEVVAVEQAVRTEQGREGGIGDVVDLFVEVVGFEESEEGDTAFGFLLAFDGEGFEEEFFESPGVEAFALVVARCEEQTEIVFGCSPAGRGEPAFALDEPQKHQTVEQGLGEHLLIFTLERLDGRLEFLELGGVVGVEALGDLFDVEGGAPRGNPSE